MHINKNVIIMKQKSIDRYYTKCYNKNVFLCAQVKTTLNMKKEEILCKRTTAETIREVISISKCPFISRSEVLHYANWEGAQKVSLLIDELPDPDPNELIAAAIKLMDSEQLQMMYLKLSECLYRAIINKSEKDDTVHFGCARPGTVVDVDITVKDGNIEETDVEGLYLNFEKGADQL